MGLLIHLAEFLIVGYGAALVVCFLLMCVMVVPILVFRWLLGLLPYQQAQRYRKPTKPKPNVAQPSPPLAGPAALHKVKQSAQVTAPIHDPDMRFAGGFDRWTRASIGAKSVCCTMDPYWDHAFDQHGVIWWWQSADKIWMLLDEENEVVIREDNRVAVIQFRRAIPIIRLFMSATHIGERIAAVAALGRLADILSQRWKKGDDELNQNWSATGLYWQALGVHRWQLLGDDPPAYDEAIEEALRRLEPAASS